MNAIKWALVLAATVVLAGCVGYGYPLGGAYPSDGGYYGQGDPDYGDGGYYGGGAVRCESNDGRTRRCNVDTRGGVRLSRQLSDTRCVQGRNWGYDRSGIWVSGGCRAEFVLGTGGGGYYPGTGGGYGQTIRCESRDNRRNRCSVSVRGGVQLVRRLSDRGCDQGRDWGWDRSGIWVDNGCRAEFRVY